MEQIFKRLILYWVGATLVILFTTKPESGEGGVMAVIQSPQLYGVLAEGFYYGAIIMAIQRLFDRSKMAREDREKKELAAHAAAAEAAGRTGEEDDPALSDSSSEGDDSADYSDEFPEDSEDSKEPAPEKA